MIEEQDDLRWDQNDSNQAEDSRKKLWQVQMSDENELTAEQMKRRKKEQDRQNSGFDDWSVSWP